VYSVVSVAKMPNRKRKNGGQRNRRGADGFTGARTTPANYIATLLRAPRDVPTLVSSMPVIRTTRIQAALAGGATYQLTGAKVSAQDAADYLGSSSIVRFGHIGMIAARVWLVNQDGTTPAATTLGPPRLHIKLLSSLDFIRFEDIGTAVLPAVVSWRWSIAMQQNQIVAGNDTALSLVEVENQGLSAKLMVFDLQFSGTV
jgi:hypothetical protein